MIGLDTNILVRYILNDDPVWSQSAQNFIDNACTIDNPGYINFVVLAELMWLLSNQPSWGRVELATVVDQLLRADNLEIEDPELLEIALSKFRSGKADFADYLIAGLNEKANAAPTITIDRVAARDSGFQKLPKVNHV